MKSGTDNLKILLQFFIAIACAMALAILQPNFLDWVRAAGQTIPQKDIIGDYFTAVIWAFVLGFSILFWPVSFHDKRALLVVWLIKIFVTLGIMLFYEHIYGGKTGLDAFGYFYDSIIKNFAWEYFKFGDGTPNITNLARLHRYIIPESYHALKVTTAMIGMIAVYIFYRAICLFWRHDDVRIFYVLALYPSILFWSSILGKDPIMFVGVALYAYAVVGWQQFGQVRYLLWGALGVWLASFIRLWYAPILLAPLAVFILIQSGRFYLKVVFMVIVTIAFLFSWSLFAEQFSIESSQDLVSASDTVSSSWGSEGGSGQQISGGITSIGSMLAFMPIGSFTALFRPLPGEILNPFGLLAGFENFILLFLFILALKRTQWKEIKEEPILLWAIATVIVWGTIYGFVSYQNLGSAVRFKLQILPILLALLVYLARDRNKLSRPQETDNLPMVFLPSKGAKPKHSTISRIIHASIFQVKSKKRYYWKWKRVK
ncbi:hypothetical protein PN36_16440 [Candidatus Thiomargarita nelsonii]|uniref:Glycosyltransferase RgtA/B/C/D-like domain-containing protein n=1 Tax=Candidatus Thiomargarita nelsonii TaxID=1003181 RepID=A0A4E0R351_9GAMM|nr:hypothetical protein PN36_16440 [Candidatus Thiomargarita nelsonii]